MSRPLTASEAVAALRRGCQVEQFLSLSGGQLTYLTVAPFESGFRVCRHVVHDEGDEGFRDITEFSPVDESELVSEGVIVAAGESPEAAIAAADGQGGQPDRWVNAGMAADDYWRVRRSTEAGSPD